MTLEGHDDGIRSISYSPDGKQMISGGWDKTSRRWNLQAGMEIEDVRDVCEWAVHAVAVSMDGRWVITAGRDENRGELKAREVETGMVKTFQLEGHSQAIYCIDISKDNTLLASGSVDNTAKIWSIDTGKLVAGPFKNADWVGAIRFSRDSKKLAINSHVDSCLEVWDFDASTLETLGAPFQGHTKVISGLALSFDGALLASTSGDNTIKLWAFESRQLLASFTVLNPYILTLSPNSRQLAYTTFTKDEIKIFICNTPPDVLASIGLAPEDNVHISCIYLSFMW
ncbi:WD40 repeat-like protein [Rhizopogon salebrosus TDB-379]|nr:WD40 repeat-like protein [Rhizopogon salebrosus TDB-379]